MTSSTLPDRKPRSLASVLGLIGVVAAASIVPFGTIATIIVLVLLAATILGYFALFASVLTIRSSLDVFTDVGFSVGVRVLNIAAAVALFLLLFACMNRLHSYVHGQPRRLTPVERLFLAWLAFLLVTVGLAVAHFGNATDALREWIRLSSIGAVLYLSTEFSIAGRARTIVTCVLLAGIVPVLVGLWQLLSGSADSYAGVPRINGTFYHPITFSMFLTLMIALSLWKLRLGRARSFWIVVLLAEGACLVGTASFTGIAVLGILATYLAYCSGWRARVGIAAAAGLIAAGFLLSPASRSRLTELPQTGNIGDIIVTGESTNSLTWRVLHWYLLYQESRPYRAVGTGLATVQHHVSPVQNDAHNDAVQMLVETGPAGLAFYIFMWIAVFRTFQKGRRRASDPDIRLLSEHLVGMALALMAASLVDNVVNGTAMQYYLWALVGMVTGELKRQADQPATPRTGEIAGDSDA